MRRLCTLLIAALPALCAGAASAATGASAGEADRNDPLQAPDCRSALAALQDREAAADAAAHASAAAHGQAAPSAELLAARRLAARRCLASRGDLPAPSRSIQPPIVVAPIAPAAAARSPPTVTRTTPAAPAPAERPRAVTACDPGGCWADDGSRLTRIGPNLWGKRGICTLQGSLLLCP